MASRIENSIRNMKYAALGQGIVIAMSFTTRMVFVRYLPVEYLGLNGLFGNIIAMLNLAELGVGSSIIYSLYKPLAEKDEEKVAALMRIYKKTYHIIGVVVAILGIMLLPFLTLLINDPPDISNMYVIYLLFLLNAVMSYFAIYKQSLIRADQQEYIITNYHSIFTVTLNVTQITFLILTRAYLIFLILQILSTTLFNIVLAHKVDKKYPYLSMFKQAKLPKADIKTLTRNIRAMMVHKIGGFIVNGTDNILLTNLASLVIVGLYSNYLLIINGLWTIYNIIFRSFSASIGNLGATSDEEKLKFNFNVVNLLGFWLLGFSAICLYILFTPFITLWLGEAFLLSAGMVHVITLNFYLRGMRLSVLTFHDTLGLFWYGRHKPIFESIINLVFSIFLGIHYGAVGILLGTTISTFLTCFWIEPYILYKYGFKSPVREYFIKHITYSLLCFLSLMLVQFLVSWITVAGMIGFITLSVATVFLTNIIFIALFHRTKEFKYLFNIVIFKLFLGRNDSRG